MKIVLIQSWIPQFSFFIFIYIFEKNTSSSHFCSRKSHDSLIGWSSLQLLIPSIFWLKELVRIKHFLVIIYIIWVVSFVWAYEFIRVKALFCKGLSGFGGSMTLASLVKFHNTVILASVLARLLKQAIVGRWVVGNVWITVDRANFTGLRNRPSISFTLLLQWVIELLVAILECF